MRGFGDRAVRTYFFSKCGRYAGHRYRAALKHAETKQCMSPVDNGYDNACTESCFGTLKTELVTEYEHVDGALRDRRIHQVLQDRPQALRNRLTDSQPI